MTRVLLAAFRGAVGAMAMTGMRTFAAHAGLIRESPPNQLAKKGMRGVVRRIPRKRRPMVVELVHWIVGAMAGALFGLLPDRVRHLPGSGPVYGVTVWLGFDAVVAPALGLQVRDWPRAHERAVFLADHALFGLVLDELGARAQE